MDDNKHFPCLVRDVCGEDKRNTPTVTVPLFDGHLTHTSASTTELAIKENISKIKLPAHTTDLLQPLNVACFNPLKTYYEKHLTARVHQTGTREPLRKAAFGNLLSITWRRGLFETNIKSGFRATGIFPVNSSMIHDTPAQPLPRPSSEQPSTSGHVNAKRRLDYTPTMHSTTDDPMLEKSPSIITKELQKYAPEGMRYVVTLVPKDDETPLDQLIKSRGRPSTTAQPAKQHRISMHGAALTDEDYKKQLKEKGAAKTKGPKKKPVVRT